MIHTYMSIRRTNYIKPERVQKEAPLNKRLNNVHQKPAEKKMGAVSNPARMTIDEKRAKIRDIREKQAIAEQRKQTKIQQRVNPRRASYSYGSIPKIWKDQTVYIVAGGASLSDFDFNRLNGKNVIAINKAFRYVKEPGAIYWTDSRFYTWYKSEIDEIHCMKFTGSTNPRDLAPDVTLLRPAGGKTVDLTSPDNLSTGNNSGYGAISLAIKLGAKKIYLLGYDMGHTGGKSHFHDGYPAGNSRDHIYKGMMRYFNDNADILNHAAEIYNTNPKSNLKVFKFCNLSSIF